MHGNMLGCNSAYRLRYWNKKVADRFELTGVGCNSAYRLRYWNLLPFAERTTSLNGSCNSAYRLRYWNSPKPRIRPFSTSFGVLQQYLPFTVLKLAYHECYSRFLWVATVLTVYGIETIELACRYENGF